MGHSFLYYPNIEFQAEDYQSLWNAALFADKIYRIVPPNYELSEPRNIKALCSTDEIGIPISPVPYAVRASQEFCDFMDRNQGRAAALSLVNQEEIEYSETAAGHHNFCTQIISFGILSLNFDWPRTVPVPASESHCGVFTLLARSLRIGGFGDAFPREYALRWWVFSCPGTHFTLLGNIRLNTGFKSAMIVTERFSQFNSSRSCRVWNLISIGYGRDAPMYAITNDYFDSFSAIFGPRECLLNGKWYPLGHFAAEALEMDKSLLWKLKAAVAEFKPELKVFLAARTASSAAVAQQKLDAVWAILDQIPAYKNLRGSFSGSQGLFHSMREHPDRTDDSVTEGTNFHRALAYWLDRLERLPDAVDDFIGNTSLMLGDYFENLPARSPAAYAEAYEKYRRTMDAAFQYAEEEDEVDEDLDSIQLDFSVRLGFRAMAAKDGSAVFGEELTFNELASFLYTDLYKGMVAGNVPRRCHNCKHFFLTVGGHDTVYCNRVAPDETKRTCRQVGAHRKEKRKNQAPILKEYSRAYNRLKGRKSRGSISTDKWNQQVAMIQDWRDAALKGELSDAEFKQRLDGV